MVQPIKKRHVSISQGRSGWCPFRLQWVPELSYFEQITTNLYFQFGGRWLRSICQTAQNAFSSSTPSNSGWCKLFKSPFYGDSSSLAGRDHRADWKGLEVACGFVPWLINLKMIKLMYDLLVRFGMIDRCMFFSFWGGSVHQLDMFICEHLLGERMPPGRMVFITGSWHLSCLQYSQTWRSVSPRLSPMIILSK